MIAEGKIFVPLGHDEARQRLGDLRRMFDRMRLRVWRKLAENNIVDFCENQRLGRTNRSHGEIRKDLMTQALTFIACLLWTFLRIPIRCQHHRRLSCPLIVAFAKEFTRVTREHQHRKNSGNEIGTKELHGGDSGKGTSTLRQAEGLGLGSPAGMPISRCAALMIHPRPLFLSAPAARRLPRA